MAVSYEFCVTRSGGARNESFGARYSFGDIDPGKEVARVIVATKCKTEGDTSVSLSDYSPDKCGNIRDSHDVTMTADQLKQLAEAIGRRDPAAAAAVAVEVVVGVPVRIIEGAGDALKNAKDWLGGRLGF